MKDVCHYCEKAGQAMGADRHGEPCCQACHDYLDGKTPEGKALQSLIRIGARELLRGKMYSKKGKR